MDRGKLIFSGSCEHLKRLLGSLGGKTQQSKIEDNRKTTE
jgi:hypothetical protein